MQEEKKQDKSKIILGGKLINRDNSWTHSFPDYWVGLKSLSGRLEKLAGRKVCITLETLNEGE